MSWICSKIIPCGVGGRGDKIGDGYIKGHHFTLFSLRMFEHFHNKTDFFREPPLTLSGLGEPQNIPRSEREGRKMGKEGGMGLRSRLEPDCKKPCKLF